MVLLKELPGLRTRRLFLNFSLLFVALLLSLLPAAAQEEAVILPTREASVRTVLEEINRQTSYRVVADLDRFDSGRIVLFPANRLSVRDILGQAFAGTGFTWRVDGRQITVSASPEGDRMLYSAMFRNDLPQQMKVVVDPLSNVRITSNDLSRIRGGYWQRDASGADSLGLAVLNFRVNRTNLERNYMDNARVLNLLHRTFSDRELLAAMDFITVTAAASPEGNTLSNDRLAADRAMAIKNYILEMYPQVDRNRIYTFSIGEDWSGLRKMVEDDYGMPYRYEVLRILNNDGDSNAKRNALRAIDNGRAFQYITDNMFPYLRGAAACMLYLKSDAVPGRDADNVRLVDTIYIETTTETIVNNTLYVKKPQYYAVKTNLLYDAALLPNLALEFSLGSRWSVEVEGNWSWWNTQLTHYNCWRIQTAGLEFRKWLGDPEQTPLTGHYLGLYGMAGTYDVRFKGKVGHLSDMSYSFGISYGYSFPISRSLNMEFGIGVGYFGGKYERYQWDNETETFPWISTERRRYFGPTKAKASLVWLLGSGKNWDKNRK